MDQQKIGAFIAQRRKAMGMTQLQLAETLGITEYGSADILRDIIASFNLPTCLPYDEKAILEHMLNDKKVRNGKLNMILLESLGKSKIVRLIAVPPFKAIASDKSSSDSINLSTSAKRQTFSKVSLTKPNSFAILPSVNLSNCIIIPYPFIYQSF